MNQFKNFAEMMRNYADGEILSATTRQTIILGDNRKVNYSASGVVATDTTDDAFRDAFSESESVSVNYRDKETNRAVRVTVPGKAAARTLYGVKTEKGRKSRVEKELEQAAPESNGAAH